MTINKTIFSESEGANRLAEVRSWLATNATDYFSTVTEIASNEFYCKKGTNNVVKFQTGTQNAHTIYLANGTTRNTYGKSTFNADYAVKTSKGIAIHFPKDTTLNIVTPITLIITKSNDNGLAIAYVGMMADAGLCFLICDFEKSLNLSPYVAKSYANLSDFNAAITTQAELTVLSPIPAKNTNGYGVGVYQTNYTQFPQTEAIISVNGKNYYTNGYLALEE